MIPRKNVFVVAIGISLLLCACSTSQNDADAIEVYDVHNNLVVKSSKDDVLNKFSQLTEKASERLGDSSSKDALNIISDMPADAKVAYRYLLISRKHYKTSDTSMYVYKNYPVLHFRIPVVKNVKIPLSQQEWEQLKAPKTWIK